VFRLMYEIQMWVYIMFFKALKSVARKINGFLDLIAYPIMDLCVSPNNKNRYLFINTFGIGDMLIMLPYYRRFCSGMEQRELFFLGNKPLEIIHVVLPDAHMVKYSWSELVYNPFYRWNLNLVPFKFAADSTLGGDFFTVVPKIRAEKYILYKAYVEKSLSGDLCEKQIIFECPVKHVPWNHASDYIRVCFENMHKLHYGVSATYEINPMEYNETERIFADVSILKRYELKEKDYIIIITDAAVKFRRYSETCWQQVLNGLPTDIPIVQLGLDCTIQLHHPKLINLTGKTKLLDALTLAANAVLCIGCETGLTHAAYLNGVKTVCILGGGHFGRFLPWDEFKDIVSCAYVRKDCYYCDWKCKCVDINKAVPPCISDIPPELVLELALRQLAGKT